MASQATTPPLANTQRYDSLRSGNGADADASNTADIDAFVAALDTYIRSYNDTRIKSSLGFRSPTEYRRSLGFAPA